MKEIMYNTSEGWYMYNNSVLWKQTQRNVLEREIGKKEKMVVFHTWHKHKLWLFYNALTEEISSLSVGNSGANLYAKLNCGDGVQCVRNWSHPSVHPWASSETHCMLEHLSTLTQKTLALCMPWTQWELLYHEGHTISHDDHRALLILRTSDQLFKS